MISSYGKKDKLKFGNIALFKGLVHLSCFFFNYFFTYFLPIFQNRDGQQKD